MNGSIRSGRLAGPARVRGITLMELMITVVIVGILAAVAYPSYVNQVQKTRRSDGQGALLQAAQQLERCFTLYQSYTNANCAAHVDINNGGRLSPEGWYLVQYEGAPTATTFKLVATAQGAQTDDTRCGNLSLTHQGTQGRSGTAPLDECW